MWRINEYALYASEICKEEIMSKLIIERDHSIDFMRSIASMAVVLMHVVATFWYSTPVRYLTLDGYYVQQSEYITLSCFVNKLLKVVPFLRDI